MPILKLEFFKNLIFHHSSDYQTFLLEVAEQNGQEEVEQNDFPQKNKYYEECAGPRRHRKIGLVHDLVPVIPDHDLKDSHDTPE
jgi:hypothetical protein